MYVLFGALFKSGTYSYYRKWDHRTLWKQRMEVLHCTLQAQSDHFILSVSFAIALYKLGTANLCIDTILAVGRDVSS